MIMWNSCGQASLRTPFFNVKSDDLLHACTAIFPCFSTGLLKEMSKKYIHQCNLSVRYWIPVLWRWLPVAYCILRGSGVGPYCLYRWLGGVSLMSALLPLGGRILENLTLVSERISSYGGKAKAMCIKPLELVVV